MDHQRATVQFLWAKSPYYCTRRTECPGIHIKSQYQKNTLIHIHHFVYYSSQRYSTHSVDRQNRRSTDLPHGEESGSTDRECEIKRDEHMCV